MAFFPLGNSVSVVSVSIVFQSNSKWDASFHCIAYDCSCADLDSLCDHLRDASWEGIFKLSASASAREFCVWIQVVSPIVSINSSLTFTHLHCFQLLVQLP